MPKPIGPVCNLACEYCYYSEKTRAFAAPRDFRMSDGLLQLYIRQYLRSQPADPVCFTWHGGEPLLRGIPFFKRAVEYQRKYAGSRRIENSIQTNGLLLDDDWCRFFGEHGFLVGLSIDGPEHVHDRYRRGRKGQASFADAVRGMKLLGKHEVQFNTLSVVNDYSSQYPLDVYRFFKAQGIRFMQFIPVVECQRPTAAGCGSRLLPPEECDESLVTPWSVKPENFGRFLADIFDEWVVQDVGSYFVQFFDATLANWCGLPPPVCVLAKLCGSAGVLEHDGDLFSCDHYVFPEYLLGNIREKSLSDLMRSEKQKRFGRRKSDGLTAGCRQCEYLQLCYGECPKNRFARSPSGEKGHNYLCAGLKRFFRHSEPYMRFMRKELINHRSAVNVMDWAKRNQTDLAVAELRHSPL